MRCAAAGNRVWVAASLALALIVGCARPGPDHVVQAPGDSGAVGAPQDPAATAEIRQRYAVYTVERAQQEGYVRDAFCLDALSFGIAGSAGAMGFHATNESLLRGPITPDRPQAIMFDAQGRVLGVEYEITTDVAREAPRLFGQTFNKLPPHPGVHHEHYALHVWFVPNPTGQFADFNPLVVCPPGSTPQRPASQPTRPLPAAEPQGPVPGPAVQVEMEDHGH